jgi:hypothetical protein
MMYLYIKNPPTSVFSVIAIIYLLVYPDNDILCRGLDARRVHTTLVNSNYFLLSGCAL